MSKKFFSHGGPPRTQREYAVAVTKCIEVGAFEHAKVLIKKIQDQAVRMNLEALLEEKKGT